MLGINGAITRSEYQTEWNEPTATSTNERNKRIETTARDNTAANNLRKW